MSENARSMILKRRSAAIADLSGFDISKDGVTFDEALTMGIYKVNASAQVGIATATETGLETARYPVRVIINTGNTARVGHISETCVSYWPVVNASNGPLQFQRRSLQNDVAVANLYRHFPTFDKDTWSCYNAARRTARAANRALTITMDAAQEANRNSLFALLVLPNPTDEQKTQMIAHMSAIFAASTAGGTVAHIRITNEGYIMCAPHGIPVIPPTGMTSNAMMLKEAGLTLMVNRALMKARRDGASDGSLSLAAYAVVAMFRSGLYEEYEHREYVTLTVNHNPADPNAFTVASIDAPEGYDTPATIAVGQALSIAGLKFDNTMVQLGYMLVFQSGLMHYMYNHTTGGTRLSGPMLAVCSMYAFMKEDLSKEEQTEVTSLVYEAVHPTNKRAIANIFFKRSRVYTHGRSSNAYPYEQIEVDAFTQIRLDPHPAGAHKAVICAQALRRVLISGMAPFLPWASSIQTVVGTCRDILQYGAYAHIGSNYYTGHSPTSQASSLDLYLPDLARYMHTFHALDSLTASPHMGMDVASRSDAKWTALLRDIKGKDISGVSSDVVQSFLAATGVGAFGFDPDNQETWAVAAQRSTDALAIINDLHV